MAGRPPDFCPHPRPFPEGFQSCAAFHRSDFVALDTQFRFLSSLSSCRHLEVRSAPARPAAFYGACALGDADARAAWVRQVESRRLDAIRGLGRALGADTLVLTQELWVAKGEQLRALRAGEAADRHTNRLQRVVDDYVARAAAFLDVHGADLQTVKLTAGECLDLIRHVLRNFVEARTLENLVSPPDVFLERFPPAVRVLLRPNA